MTKNLIIIALIVIIIYLAYQQRNQTNTSENSQAIQDLQTELKHYQTLYDKKINQDLGLTNHDQLSEIIFDYEALEEEKAKHNEQLRKINLLFDANAGNYQTIDFKGLYALLTSIAEREREQKGRMIMSPCLKTRESKIAQYPAVENENNDNSPLSHKAQRKLKKKKK
ncbi:MAG: hypothetical protein mread185_000044 [Mycoplasmataceae bacterium]|nr:MAG: hypothetical protein mread185_000044 [Mycoplasmataceae bacterium]